MKVENEKNYCKEKAGEMLEALGVPRDLPINVQSWDETSSQPFLNQTLYGKFDDIYPKIVELNKQGAGIGFALNHFDGSGKRRRENVVGIRCLTLDADNNLPVTLKITPSLVTKTKRGYHPYLKIKKEDQFKIKECEEVARKLAIVHATDISVSEPTRAMRAVGFYHVKEINDPFLIEIIEKNNVEYSLAEIKDAYKDEFSTLDIEYAATPQKKFKKWYEDQPFHNGVRNNTLYAICGHGLNRGLTPSEIKNYVEDYIHKSGMTNEEGYGVFEKVLKRNNETPPDARPKIYEVAKKFIEINYTDDSGQLLIRYFSGDFCAYKDGVYKVINHESFKAMVTNFIHTHEKLHDVSIKKYREDVIATIQSNCLASIEFGKSFWLNDPTNNETYICLKNGLLNVDKYLKGDLDCLIDHTPQYFSTNQLPFDFKFGAACPTWTSFLDSIFDQKEIITLLQSWFGYNLIPDTSFQKFCLLHGKGANGKSVITIILTALLGEENVSCLGLECFDQSRTFALAGLINKLANIVGEMNEVSKASEGLLKNIVSGELISIDRKYREPISYRPTARLTFATNVLPRISDRSDGISRRLILIPFEKQFLEEEKQDRRLSSLKFWIESGELSGVFEWALQGLKFLKEKGRFEIPSKVQEAIDNYVIQSNPTFEYLKTHYKYSKEKRESKQRTYSSYEGWMNANGFSKLNANNFSNEVRRAFPLVEASKNQYTFEKASIYSCNLRDRAWLGLTKVEDDGEQLDQ